MKLKAKLMMFTAAVAFSAGMANAAITANDVVKTYQDANYTGIQVVEGPTQIKVEAVKDGVKMEVIYDKASGDVIKQETQPADSSSNQSGVEVVTTDKDFTSGDGADDNGQDASGSDDGSAHDAADDNGSDDSSAHDSGDDNGSGTGASDDSGDDNSGSGSDSSGDGGSDNGGNDNGGSDNGGSDNGGSDNGGSDDNGSDN